MLTSFYVGMPVKLVDKHLIVKCDGEELYILADDQQMSRTYYICHGFEELPCERSLMPELGSICLPKYQNNWYVNLMDKDRKIEDFGISFGGIPYISARYLQESNMCDSYTVQT